MRDVKLSKQRMYELALVIDSIPVADLATIKDIRLTASLVKDLKDVCKEYAQQSDDFYEKVRAVAKPYQDKYNVEVKDLAEEVDRKALAARLDAQLDAEVESKFPGEKEALEAMSKSDVIASLSDEKFGKLKELFEKHGVKMYRVRDVVVEISDALGIE